MSSCVFCKIIAGEIPSHRVLETPASVAFLDVGPLAEGHVLLLPRRHAERLEHLSAEEMADLARSLPALAAAISAVTGAAGLNLLQNNGAAAGQVVPHVHFHLIPRREGDGLGYRWNPGQYSAGRAEAIRAALRGVLQ